MKIFLIWLAIVLGGIANGYFISHYGEPENYVFASVSSIVCAIALYIHRRVTKDWVPRDPWTEIPHLPVFSITLFFSLFIALLFFEVGEVNTYRMVACASVAVTSFIAHLREIKYTE